MESESSNKKADAGAEPRGTESASRRLAERAAKMAALRKIALRRRSLLPSVWKS